MNASAITKTLQKVSNLKNENPEYSLGFARWASLPNRVAKNVILSCALKGEKTYWATIDYLETLNDSEFLNWLKVA